MNDSDPPDAEVCDTTGAGWKPEQIIWFALIKPAFNGRAMILMVSSSEQPLLSVPITLNIVVEFNVPATVRVFVVLKTLVGVQE